MTKTANQKQNKTQQVLDAVNQVYEARQQDDVLLQVLGMVNELLGAEVDCCKADDHTEIDEKRIGVYIFVDASCNALYAGEATAGLKKRICQYYSENDTGATFTKNWRERKGKKFGDFKEHSKNWKIITMFVDKSGIPGEHKKQSRLIYILEKALIAFLDPPDNKK